MTSLLCSLVPDFYQLQKFEALALAFLNSPPLFLLKLLHLCLVRCVLTTSSRPLRLSQAPKLPEYAFTGVCTRAGRFYFVLYYDVVQRAAGLCHVGVSFTTLHRPSLSLSLSFSFSFSLSLSTLVPL